MKKRMKKRHSQEDFRLLNYKEELDWNRLYFLQFKRFT